MDKRQIIREFIATQKLAVLATITKERKPQAAVLEFGDTDDLEIIIDTFPTARKYENLRQNKSVSLVIGWDENITVQYEGEAQELEGEELEKSLSFVYFKGESLKLRVFLYLNSIVHKKTREKFCSSRVLNCYKPGFRSILYLILKPACHGLHQ